MKVIDVACCAACPFVRHGEDGDTSWYCIGTTNFAAQTADDDEPPSEILFADRGFDAARPPPAWCPLRAENQLVRLSPAVKR